MSLGFIARILEHGRRVASGARVVIARATGVELGNGCRLGPGCDLALGVAWPRQGRIRIDDHCELETGVIVRPYGGSIQVGRHVFVGAGSAIYGHGGVTIGESTLIAMHCRILSSNHEVPPLGTMIRMQPDVLLPTRIGRDVWLGAGVTVLGGVTIGDGCVVGAGAVVTKDLLPGTISHGVPARVHGHRPDPPAASG